MRVTSKGQVTIPIEVRERLGISEETEVEFEVVGDEARLRVVGGPRRRGEELVEALRGRATSEVTTDEVMRLTRGTE